MDELRLDVRSALAGREDAPTVGDLASDMDRPVALVGRVLGRMLQSGEIEMVGAGYRLRAGDAPVSLAVLRRRLLDVRAGKEDRARIAVALQELTSAGGRERAVRLLSALGAS